MLETEKPILVLEYSQLSKLVLLIGSIALLSFGLGFVVFGNKDEQILLSGIAFGLGLVLINQYSKKVYLYEHKVVAKTWLRTKTLAINLTTKLKEGYLSEDKNGGNEGRLYIETGDQQLNFDVKGWKNYPEFKKTLQKTIAELKLSFRLSNTYTKGKVKVVRTSSRGKIHAPKAFVYEGQKNNQIEDNFYNIGIGFGIFISLIGVITFFRTIYTSEGTDLNISYEPFLMAVGLGLVIYFAMFSGK